MSRINTNMQFCGVDLIKFIMSFAVIAIHAPEYLWPDARSYSFVIDWFIRLAVPFFFITSGFLVQKKLDLIQDLSSKRNYLRNRAVRLFRIWVIWILIYFPLSLWGFWHINEPIYDKIIKYIAELFLTGQSLYAQPLWFIYSLAIVTGIWRLVIGNIKTLWVLFCGSVIVSLMGFIAKSCLFYDCDIFCSFTTWMIGGAMPVFGGAIIYSYFHHIKKHIFIFFAGLAGISMVLNCIGAPFGPFLGGVALFFISYLLPPLKCIDYVNLRKCSMWIYYLHMYVIMTLMVFIRHFHISLPKMILLLIVCCMTWLISKCLIGICSLQKFNGLEALIR